MTLFGIAVAEWLRTGENDGSLPFTTSPSSSSETRSIVSRVEGTFGADFGLGVKVSTKLVEILREVHLYDCRHC